ncbi:hypothetical protein CRYUN_Cryun16bG0040800 [Craigia yunnanensis]
MNYAPNINVLQSSYGLLLCESVVDSPKDIISSMAFDPLKSPHYKIICVRKASDKLSKCELDIYSSETDSWSLSGINFDLNYSIRFEDAIFCNGKIHWNCYWKDSLYFDSENESLETLPMPISTMEAPMERSYFAE